MKFNTFEIRQHLLSIHFHNGKILECSNNFEDTLIKFVVTLRYLNLGDTAGRRDIF